MSDVDNSHMIAELMERRLSSQTTDAKIAIEEQIAELLIEEWGHDSDSLVHEAMRYGRKFATQDREKFNEKFAARTNARTNAASITRDEVMEIVKAECDQLRLAIEDGIHDMLG